MQQRVTFADNWNTLEQACLASTVRLFGDLEINWSLICNHLKSKFPLIDRPSNWLTPESCEAQYKWLSDKYVRMEISCERPVNQIIQNLKQIGECESKHVLEQEKTYKELKKRLELCASNEVDSEIISEFYEDACKRNREREESRKKQGVKNDSPNVTKPLKADNKTDGSSPTTTSPLLSSLLNNPPAVQYRPTLSTASFIPNKTSQGTSRASHDRVHTPESSQRGSYSPSVGSQSSPGADRPSFVNSSAAPHARKLDFQDASTSAVSYDPPAAAKETIKDTVWSNEPAKSDIHNLENINLIPTTEEIDPDILLQVIGNLEDKSALDKVLDELTGEKESNIEKDLNTVTIPSEDSFVADSPATKGAVQVTIAPTESKPTAAHDTSAMNAEFESLGHQYAATEDVIIIEEDTSNEQQVTDETNIASVEQSTLLDNTPSISDSPVSVAPKESASETVPEPKLDSEPVIEYLDASAVEKTADESVEGDEKMEAKLENDGADIRNGNEENRELIEEYEDCSSVPQTLETHDVAENGESSVVEIPCDDTEQPTTDTDEPLVETAKESAIVQDPSPEDRFDVENIPVTEFDEAEKAEADESAAVPEEVKSEQLPETEEASAESPKISKAIEEIEQTVDAHVSVSTLPTIVEEPVPISAGERIVDVKPSAPAETVENQETEKAASKSRRQPSRRRRSTASDVNESPRITRTDETETTLEDVEAVTSVKEIANDTEAEVFVAESVVKAENQDDPALQAARTSPTKTKSTSKPMDVKKPKPKPSVGRRSSIRTQNQNSPAPKPEETMVSPATPSSSRTSDSAAKCKKSLVLSQQRLASQKYSSAFLKPISNKTVPGYEDLIYSPIDLHTIKKKIDTKVMKTVAEFEKDVLLMILNAKMFNRVNPQVYNMAVEMQKEALKEIQLTVKTLGEGVLLEVEDDTTEKARKRQAVENLKKDPKPTKRSKPMQKDESTPAKKIKLEENEPAT